MNQHLLKSSNEWMDIPGYEGKYKISIFGDIKSLPRTAKIGKGHSRTVPECLVSTHVSSAGILTVRISRNNKARTFSVVQLMARTFLKNPMGAVSAKCTGPLHIGNISWIDPDTAEGKRIRRVREGLKKQSKMQLKRREIKYIDTEDGNRIVPTTQEKIILSHLTYNKNEEREINCRKYDDCLSAAGKFNINFTCGTCRRKIMLTQEEINQINARICQQMFGGSFDTQVILGDQHGKRTGTKRQSH